MWKVRLYRWRRRILLPIAMMPLFQTMGACDPNSVSGAFGSQLGLAALTLITTSVRQTLIQDLPSSDILQFLLGNPQPFFTG